MMALLLMFLMILIVLHFKYKQKITGETENDGTKDVQIMGPLNYLSILGKLLTFL